LSFFVEKVAFFIELCILKMLQISLNQYYMAVNIFGKSDS
jgi:hypothetical protein